MRVDLRRTDTWDNINQAYRDGLGLTQSTLQVQTYMGLHHALWEVCTQLTQLVPNKRTIYYLNEAGPMFEPIAVHLSREGFKLKALSAQELANPSTWYEAVQKELLFICDIADDPVTGELFEFPELDTILADKRTYRLTASFSKHNSLPFTNPTPYRANLLSLGAGRAVAILGERVRVLPPVASGLVWPTPSKDEIAAQLKVVSTDEYKKMRERVENFEKNLPDGAKILVQSGTPRLFDRTVFYFSDLDGLSLVEELARETGLKLFSPGEMSVLETTSLCRWHDEKVWQGMLSRGLHPEQLRGLVAISAEVITDDLKTKIIKARERVLKLQDG